MLKYLYCVASNFGFQYLPGLALTIPYMHLSLTPAFRPVNIAILVIRALALTGSRSYRTRAGIVQSGKRLGLKPVYASLAIAPSLKAGVNDQAYQRVKTRTITSTFDIPCSIFDIHPSPLQHSIFTIQSVLLVILMIGIIISSKLIPPCWNVFL